MLERPSSKAGWARVAFGDVVRLSKGRAANPDASGIDRVVGLEHIEPGDLRIRRWGEVAGGTTFTTLFKPGHVLFGKRRAYQRKVAVADFEGVCSGDIYVLEPANDRLKPELLPFICQSDTFFDHAVSTSAGSLSPRTNWTSLASFEFLLPPVQEQAKLVEILTAGVTVVESLRSLRSAAEAVYNSMSLELLGSNSGSGIKPSGWMKEGWTICDLADLIQADAPICYGIVQVGQDTESGIPTLAIHNLSGGLEKNVHRASPQIEADYRRSRVSEGDVVISIKGTIGEILTIPRGFSGNISRDLAKLRLNPEKINTNFFEHLYRSPLFAKYRDSLVVGSTRAELSIATLRGMQVPLPTLEIQHGVARVLNDLSLAACDVSLRVERAQHVLRSLLQAASVASPS